jgi:glycosyltransferase involved in cell wall biosynthesis
LQKYGGISRYFARLLQELKDSPHDPHVFAPFHRNQYLKNLPNARICGGYFAKYPKKTTKLFFAANKFVSDRCIRRWNPHVVHETYYGSIGVTKKKSPVVVTVHDMIHEIMPECFLPSDPTSRQKQLSVKRADHVICVSENTKKDLQHYYDIADDKISVIHHGHDSFSQSRRTVVSDSPESEPFILYVGQRSGYKNFKMLITALSMFPFLRNNVRLIAAGGGPFSSEEIAFIKKCKLHRVIQIEATDAQLSALYSEAVALVYPSLYEGFGIPLLEAFAHACPVIASRSSSIPEVVENAAAMFDPHSVEDLGNVLGGVIASKELRESLVTRGLNRLESFSWKKCASETLAVYEKVI